MFLIDRKQVLNTIQWKIRERELLKDESGVQVLNSLKDEIDEELSYFLVNDVRFCTESHEFPKIFMEGNEL